VELANVLEVRVESELDGRPFVRWMWLQNGTPAVRLRLTGSAKARRTITCRFPTTILAKTLCMDVPGGIVDRPVHKLYDPTFWPARSFVHARAAERDVGVGVFLGGPAAVAATEPGTLEWMALRYAPRETAFGFLPILAHPARGTDPHEGDFDYAVWFTTKGDARDNRLPLLQRRALRAALFPPNAPDLDDQANAVIELDRPDVKVMAIKPAYRGSGVVVRLSSFARGPVEVRLRCPSRPIKHARRCDAREHDLGDLAVHNGEVIVPVPGALASVRLEM
jgi:alpha-mannosidase